MNDVIQSFHDVLLRHGLVPEEIIADGNLHRSPTEHKPRKQNGAYIAHLDRPATLWWCNWETGEQDNWCAEEKQTFTPDELSAWQERQKTIRRQREAECSRRHNGTDFNDLHQTENIEAVRSQLEAVLAQPQGLMAVDMDKFLSMEIPDRGYLLSPILPVQGIGILYAPRGVGKTFAALSVAVAVASGGEVFNWRAPLPKRILYVDGEMPATSMQSRLSSIIGGMAAPPQALKNLSLITPDLQPCAMPDLSTSNGQSMIEPFLKDMDMVVLDNISTLCRTGKENVISAMVHMDEKTPHMHFLHVPVTKDGRLCAKDIYTKAALKKLQDEMPKFLQKHGFKIERGMEQEKGSAKKHLDTKEFKQQQEMLKILQAEAANLRQSVKKMEEQLEEQKQAETDFEKRIATQKEFIAEIENNLNEKFTLRPANFFNYKEVLAEAEQLITTLKHALADKNKIAHENVQRVRQAEILLADRDQAKELAEKAVAVLKQERKDYDKLVKKLKAEKQASEQEALCMRAFMVVKGFIDNYEKFQREWQARQAAANEATIHRQSQMSNSSGRPHMR